ncbi:MAG: ParB N-terminal domain-containing protein [Alphaproteobacteria bacterium]|nr:ParB N-terminal domain-containing protein [Alphaproteobacteria bacterium]
MPSITCISVGGTEFRLAYTETLPPLDAEDLAMLRGDIKRRGAVVVPIIIDEHRNVIDGANRLRIAAEFGIKEVPVEVRVGLSEAEKMDLAEDLNTHRRHLNRDQIRVVVAQKLKRCFEKSNRQIASEAEVDHKTVGAVRRELEGRGEIPHVVAHVDTMGRRQPTRHSTATIRGVGAAQVGRVARMAAEVAEAAYSDPDRHGHLLDAMNRTGRVTGVHRNLAVSRKADEIASEPPPLPQGPFRVIVADPPWAYDARAADASHRAANPYPQMDIDAIRAMPVAELAHDDAILWLWTTNSHLREAFTVLDAWGFAHKTILTWAKDRMGTGDWLRGQTEHCLMAVRGKPVVTLSNQTTLLRGPLREHSRKPEMFYALVETLCPAPEGGRLELFARQTRPGWIAAGAEVGKFARGTP